jgi:hypothetical protein
MHMSNKQLRKQSFAVKPLSVAVAMGFSSTVPVYAQDQFSLEEVIVTAT